MKIAIVHDYLAQDGGAEKVLQELQTIFPEAPTYVLLFDKKRVDPIFQQKKICTSFLQKIPGSLKHYQWLLPLMPVATESHDLSEFDVVLSSSSAFSKGILTKPETIHLCYCHTPTRYLWSDAVSYVRELRIPFFIKFFLPPLLSKLRMWDKQAAERVDVFIANSEAVRQRIKKYYHRDALVVYPPVEIHRFQISPNPKTYYLAGGRLVNYKRYDLIIEACNRLRLPLKIFGSGPAEEELKQMAGPTIEFVGRVDENQKANLFADCIAFINPQEEDFGITAVEALASGRPVIAYHRGGALEIVTEGVNGTFFREQTWEDLAEVLIKFDHTQYNPEIIRQSSEKFSQTVFQQTIIHLIQKAWDKHCQRCEMK